MTDSIKNVGKIAAELGENLRFSNSELQILNDFQKQLADVSALTGNQQPSKELNDLYAWVDNEFKKKGIKPFPKSWINLFLIDYAKLGYTFDESTACIKNYINLMLHKD